jgi:UDP:flavonoid glycosyltransferase YjiC (YdhE family)
VRLQTWTRWKEATEAAGMGFEPAPEYQVFPTRERPLKPYQAAVHAAQATLPLVESFAPDACVADVLTVAPALAAEARGVPWATLVPHLLPAMEPGFPAYSIGARLPRTALGRALWRRTDRLVDKGLELGRREYNESRRRLGLGPLEHVHTGLSRALTLVGTLPQLEYPRAWPPWARVVGPLIWEPPGEPVEPPPGDGPVVLVAPSTSQDPGQSLLRAALEGLAREDVRVIAVSGGRRRIRRSPFRRTHDRRLAVLRADDARLRRRDRARRATARSCARSHWDASSSSAPPRGDQNENAARVEWAGVGVRLPRRLLGPRSMRLAVRRALAEPRCAKARPHRGLAPDARRPRRGRPRRRGPVGSGAALGGEAVSSRRRRRSRRRRPSPAPTGRERASHA